MTPYAGFTLKSLAAVLLAAILAAACSRGPVTIVEPDPVSSSTVSRVSRAEEGAAR